MLAALLGVLWILPPGPVSAAAETEPEPEPAGADQALQLIAGDREVREEAFRQISGGWHEGFIPMILEVGRLTGDRALRARLTRLLEMKTGQRHGQDFDRWWHWLWNRELRPHPGYPEFKAALYGLIDPRFRGYFAPGGRPGSGSTRCVGAACAQDGIPPLRDRRR